MSLTEAIVLAVVQGVTEFLPVSSSGHTILVSWLLGWDEPGLAFDVAVHAGTLAAVLLYFGRDWAGLLRGAVTGTMVSLGSGPGARPADARRVLALIVMATVPIALVGVFLRDVLEDSVRGATTAGAFLVGTGVFIALGERLGRRARALDDLGPATAAGVGLAQAVATIPGISRSGATIVAGLLGGMTREAAARFSFYLAVPAILGPAVVLAIDLAREGAPAGTGAGVLATGAAVSFATGLLAIRGLMSLLRRGSLWPFVWYCLAAGAAVLVARAAGV
ncbi:MAG: undecaprenyl-diphosphate phosphatase [Gemmatimonadetes bacterium]|nr:undecaprenyl-diphosphate phosphatase [Gemmatimonadota bacterium]